MEKDSQVELTELPSVREDEVEDQDLHTILALYDSNKFVENLEQAVLVFKEIHPAGVQEEQEGLLDDSLAVIGADLCQILQTGSAEDSLRPLIQTLTPMVSLSEDEQIPSPHSDTNSVDSNEAGNQLSKLVVDILRRPPAFDKFLFWLDNPTNKDQLYLPSALLRHQTSLHRISHSLKSLPINNKELIEINQEFIGIDNHIPSQLDHQTPSTSHYTKQHSRSRSDADVPHNKSPLKATANLRQSPTSVSLLSSNHKSHRRSSSNLTSSSSVFFSPPRADQSLLDYLQEQDTETCADLQRENAHFVVGDAVIAALENMHFDRRHNINNNNNNQGNGDGVLNSHPQIPAVESASSPPKSARKTTSAEALAIRLLRGRNSLPKARDVSWTKNFDDEGFVVVSEDDCCSSDLDGSPISRIRGTLEWAPLRQQIIYHIQPRTNIRNGMAMQKGRCAGCGGIMDSVQQGRMRYCEYTGKYFCVCCHDYKTMPVPARIILKWDFTKYYVSNFAGDFISKIWHDPLFDVHACNNDLYKRSRGLERTRLLRLELVLANQYLKSCRLAQSVTAEVVQLPKVLSEELHTYSLDMLTSVRDGILPTFMKPVTELAVQHVLNCKDCSAKGFICEVCRHGTPLFPFQLSTVFQCGQCLACYHLKCMKNKAPCPKCLRQQARRTENGSL